MKWIGLAMAALPVLERIVVILDKWAERFFWGKARAKVKDMRERSQIASLKARERKEAIKNAKKSYTADIEHIFNRND